MSKITAKHPQRSACVISVNQPRISSCTILKSAAAIWACRLRKAARLDEGRGHRRRSRTIGRRRRAARLRAAAGRHLRGRVGAVLAMGYGLTSKSVHIIVRCIPMTCRLGWGQPLISPSVPSPAASAHSLVKALSRKRVACD